MQCSSLGSLVFAHLGAIYDKEVTAVYKVFTLNSAYNEKKSAEIFLHYRWLFIKGNVFIGEWEIFGAEVFLVIADFSLRATSL